MDNVLFFKRKASLLAMTTCSVQKKLVSSELYVVIVSVAFALNGTCRHLLFCVECSFQVLLAALNQYPHRCSPMRLEVIDLMKVSFL